MSRVAVVVLLAVAAGCHDYPAGGRAGAGGAGGEPRCAPVEAERRCSAFADAALEREVRCGEVHPADVEGRRIVLTDWSCGGDRPLDPEVAALLAAGRLRYDEVETGCAVEALRDLSCGADLDESLALLARIRWPFEPATPNGEACNDNLQCAEGYCPPRVCGRTCTPWPAIGEPCGDEAPCAPGATCGGAGRCVALPGLGEECESTCAPPYTCLAPGDGGRSRCFGIVAPGDACDAFHLCRTDCVDRDPVTGIGVCAALPGEGEPCDGLACGRGAVCELPASICVPQLHPGDPCETDEGWRCYASPLFDCDPDAGRCTAIPGIGEACDPGVAWACRLGSCVDGVCAWTEPPDDAPCSDDWNCGDDRICERGRCVEGCR